MDFSEKTPFSKYPFFLIFKVPIRKSLLDSGASLAHTPGHINNRKSLGHRPVDLCLPRRVSQEHRAGVPGIFLFKSMSFSNCAASPGQGRALYGPMPVKTETFRELWAPLVHTNFRGNSYGPIIGPYEFTGEIRVDQWSWKFFKSFPLHWYWSMDGFSQQGAEKRIRKRKKPAININNFLGARQTKLPSLGTPSNPWCFLC